MNMVDLDHGVHRLLRDRRREHRRRHRRGARAEGHGSDRDRVLRRRSDEPGVLLRVPELREGARPAGRVRLREQRLRRVHGHGRRHRGLDRRRAPRRWRSPAVVVDGMDVWAVRRPRTSAAGRVRRGERPASSSRRARTGSSATLAAIPGSTGRRASWRSGASAIRCSSPSSAWRPTTASSRRAAARGRPTTSSASFGRSRRQRWRRRSRTRPCSRVQGMSEPAEHRRAASSSGEDTLGTRLRARARAARPEPARARAPARGLAEPRLADRDGQDPAVRPHALRDRQRARRLARRAVRAAADDHPPRRRRCGATPRRPDALPGGIGRVQRADERDVIDLGSGVRWERLTTWNDRDVEFLYAIYEGGGSRARTAA